MTNQVIPEAAVQAIHGAICDESLEDHLDPEWPGRCVKALEAAAPHMLRDALACGWDAAVASMVYPDGSKVEVAENTNPYRLTK